MPTTAPQTIIPDSIDAPYGSIGFAGVYSVDLKPGPSIQIESQFPGFVSEDHPIFLQLMSLYYKWMESYRNVLYDTHRITQYQDIDYSIDEFTEQFFKEFLVHIPRSVVADKKILLKNIKEFYRAKGTEKSYKLFFRMLYNTSVSFYYPRVDILKVSDGKWVQNKTIKVFLRSGTANQITGKRIIGKSSRAIAYVERVLVTQEGPITAYELFLNRSSINGKFIGSETITTEDNLVEAIVSYIPVRIKFTNTGKGYNIGDKIFVSSTEGRGATVRVTNVDWQGSILETNIDNYGIAYSPKYPIVNYPFASKTATELAYFDVELGTITNYSGSYMNEDGQLSSGKFLHDGVYYQQFSYVARVGVSSETYKDLLLRTLHPAGFKFYGHFTAETNLSAAATLPNKDFELQIKRELFPYIQSPITGTVTFTDDGTNVVGNNTQFLRELCVGDILVHSLTQRHRRVVAILSNMALQIDEPFGPRPEKNVVLFKHNGTGRHYPLKPYNVPDVSDPLVPNKVKVQQYNFFSPAINARTTVRTHTSLKLNSQRSIESQLITLRANGTEKSYVLNILHDDPHVADVSHAMSVYGEGIAPGTTVVQKTSNFDVLLSLPLEKSVAGATVVFVKDGSYPLGASYASICRHKFQFKPVAWYDENVRMLGDNQMYYGDRNNLATMKAQTPVSVFDDIFGKRAPDGKIIMTVFAIENNPKLGTNLMPDAVVTQIHKDRDPNDPASRLDPVTIASLESFGDIALIK